MRRDIYIFSVVSTIMFALCALTSVLHIDLGSLTLFQIAGMIALCALFIANVMNLGIGIKLLIQKKERNLALNVNIIASLLIIVLMVINPNLFMSFFDNSDKAASFVHLVSSLPTLITGCLVPFIIHGLMFIYNALNLYNEKKEKENKDNQVNTTKTANV